MHDECIQGFRLSDQQERLWSLGERGWLRHARCTVLLRGHVDVEVLRRAAKTITQRHEILRATFQRVEEAGSALQVIQDESESWLECIDLSDLDAHQQQLRIDTLFASEGNYPFDLTTGPVFRLTLVRLSEVMHVLLISLPALCADPETLKILFHEMAHGYEACLRGQELAGEPFSYLRFAAWQRALLADPDADKGIAYWKKQTDVPQVILRLPGEKKHAPTAGARIEKYVTHGDVQILEQISELARSSGCSVSSLLLAAWQTYLWRLTSQEEFSVATLLEGRKHDELRTGTGPYDKWVPIRLHTTKEVCLADIARQVERTLREARSWQEYYIPEPIPEPVEKLEDSLICPYAFEFRELPDSCHAAGIEFAFDRQYCCGEYFKIRLTWLKSDHGFACEYHFDPVVIGLEDVERLACGFTTLIQSVIEDDQKTIDKLNILGAAERHRICVEFNNRTSDYPGDKCLHDLFVAQAQRTPDRIAVAYGDRPLSYADLNAKTDQLAGYLHGLGIGPEAIVAVCLPRSPELVIALLGILKAGGAYVPLDPASPTERLDFMLKDTRVKILITTKSLLATCPDHDIKVICLDDDWEDIARGGETYAAGKITPQNAAYVIYTSGSTGVPKGVVITHEAVVSYTWEIIKDFGIQTEDRVLQWASPSFDVSVEEIFPALLAGAAVVPGPDIRSSGELLRLVDQEQVTIFELSTTAWHGLIDELERSRFKLPASARLVLVGCDSIMVERYRVWRRLVDQNVQLVQVYGLTETAVTSTTYHALADFEALREHSILPIGRPLANTRIYILDEHMQPVPVGVAGELCIGAAGLGRGYFDRPALTAERFVPDLFTHEPGSRLYRTGDSARYLPDGNIEFIGRVDFQVKIRGFRVELGDIEAALVRHPAVSEAVAVAREDRSGEKRLVAYLVGKTQHKPTVSELRKWLADILPEYMLPSAFVFIDALPLTPNGKVDRKALPAPSEVRPELDRAFVAPRSWSEQLLVSIWSEVLGLERVGVHDNFFELGGDSILSIQIISQASQQDLRITPRQLFEHQTIAELAAVADTEPAVQADQGPVTGEVPFTAGQKWFLEQNQPDAHHFNQAILLAVHDALEPAAVKCAVRYLLEHHDALRLRFNRGPDGWRQTIAEVPRSDLFQYVNLSSTPPHEQRSAIEQFAANMQGGFDLLTGPLIRVVLFDLGPGRPDRLLLVIHHLVVDGVSWRILLEDLETVYEQIVHNQTPRLPSKTTSLKQWSEWMVEHSATDALGQELSYWLSQVPKDISPIPVDHPGGSNSQSSDRTVSISLGSEATDALLHQVPQAYHTQINDLLLTVLVQAFERWTKRRLLLIDLESHGREPVLADVDTSRTVGWFSTLYPVFLDLKDAHTPADAIKTVKEQLRRVPAGGIGFGLLRYLSKDVDTVEALLSLPRAEVLFNYLGRFDHALGESSRFRLADEDVGPLCSPRNSRSHILEINAYIADGCLKLNWHYSEHLHQRTTIERLTQYYLDALHNLIEYCCLAETGGYTPSDFPLAGLDQNGLDRLLGVLQDSMGELAGRDVEDIHPLSHLQQGMVFHSLYAPDTGVYVGQISCTLRGCLDLAAFRRAWELVIDRHPVLRSAFIWEGLDEPMQVVRGQIELPLHCLDWRGLSEQKRGECLEDLLRTNSSHGFELSVAPLMRLTVAQIAEEAYYFVWSCHQAVVDGWSLPLLLREVFTAYEAYAGGREPQLPYTRPYRDYVAWLYKQDLRDAEGFWREQLKGFTAPTTLAVSRFTDEGQDQLTDMGERRLQLSSEATTALQTMARQHHLTVNTLVQGAWALVLSRFSLQRDVLFGVTVSGRPADLAAVDSMVGMFINTLPMRVLIDDQCPVSEWLFKLQEQNLRMRQYEHSPLVAVHGWSEVPRREPLFESILVFENYPVDASLRQWHGRLKVSDVNFIEKTNFPITLTAMQVPELSLKLAYELNRFDSATIDRLLGYLDELLSSMVADPWQCVADLPKVTGQERRQLLIEWNDTRTDYPHNLCIHDLFEAQVERTPDAPAVASENEQLSYRELNCRANKLAHYLQGQGVGPEMPVGIYMDRSVDMLVGLLGIFKAGGAYVPLDPTYPPKRIAYMLADSNMRVLVTQQHQLKNLPPNDALVVCVEATCEHMDHQSTENPSAAVTPENLAYLIYTSGSTGKPKGVQVLHRGVVNFLHALRDKPGLTNQDVLLSVTTLSFDISVLELFLPLIVGARVVIAAHEVTTDGARLANLLADSKATVMQATPATWRLLLESNWQANEHLRMLCGGEALPKELADRLLETGVSLWNLYGPTETTVWSAVWEVNPTARAVLIGRPISNTQVYVLDEQLQPVPIGVPGELYIGGDGLARGYYNRPDLTAERFVPNPFADEPGERLYRTGDSVRFLTDGNIEFFGRIDHQVKLRGHRIELGEIESVLLEHPQVRQAVVITREDRPDDKRLVAYIVPGEPQPTDVELLELLRQHLPDYMVPVGLVRLDKLPLTPSGKLDRNALPAPEPSRLDLKERFVAPRTSLEEQLAGIWREVLGLEKIGVHDNFFELGGHSLLATRVVSRSRADLNLDLPLRSIFEAPTIAGLASAVRQYNLAEVPIDLPDLPPSERAPLLLGLKQSGKRPSPVRITPYDRSAGPLQLSFAQQRLWFLDQLEPGQPVYNLPSAVRITGPLNPSALERSINEVVRQHEVLRTTFEDQAGQPVQVINNTLTVPLTVTDLGDWPESQRYAEALRSATEEGRQPFDLAHGPLIRTKLLRLDEQEHLLVLNMHHIVSDGWSMGILIRELAALYEAFHADKPSPLPELSIQYADFAQWQRQWLKGEVLDRQLEYWKRQLAGIEPLELLTDRPRSALQSSHGATESFTLDETLTEKLKALSAQEGVTLFMTLLAAFDVLLSRYTGQADIAVGSPIANRTRPEIEPLIGFFVNTLVLRTDLSGDPTFLELLARVREATLGAYGHQDLPFEMLVEQLQPQRDLSRSPLFQVGFTLQENPEQDLSVDDLKLTFVELDSGSAKYDLSLELGAISDGMAGLIEYKTGLFEAATIRRFLQHLKNILEGIVENPRQRLAELPMLTASERSRLLVEWNDTRAEYRRDACVHTLFEAQVEKIPETVAVVCDNQQLTYRQLNQRANQLAHYLRRLGVGPEVLVGLLVDRSLEMVVGILGILKAGGVYMPLDPTYPPERLRFMIQDAQAPVILTQEHLLASFPADDEKTRGEDKKVVRLDADWPIINQESVDNVCREIRADNLAYVIYTSGSTGVPKGVGITHGVAANHFVAAKEAYGLSSDDHVLQFASLSFDVSLEQIFPTLFAGARLVLRGMELWDSDELFAKVHELGLSVINLPTGYWAQVVQKRLQNIETKVWSEAPETEFNNRLRLVLIGGDTMSLEAVRRWEYLGRHKSKLVNAYGPTESTITTTRFEVPSGFCDRTSSVTTPIGRPLANRLLYILDRRWQPVPVGVPGELYIGGPLLARGYLNYPGLTAEVFLPDPFAGESSARMYRTGDLARYLPDGNIEFLGRADQQVKVRGFRIELEEIEAILNQHPGVAEVVVQAIKDKGDKRLVAYVVFNAGATPTIRELRRFLRKKVPDYMIPSAFLTLEALPLTPNGKLDRRALPIPDRARPELRAPYITPRTPTEEILAGIWTQVLEVDRVGIRDNFFELGGHSLLATQVVSRVRVDFQIDLPLRKLFESPTVAGLAETMLADPTQRVKVERTALLLKKLNQLSDQEVDSMLQERSSKHNGGSAQ